VGVTLISPQAGESWNLLFENDGPIDADQQITTLVRVQLWAAFDIPDGVPSGISIEFSGGGTSERGVVVAEYTGDIFQFENPADRVVKGSGATPPSTIGDIDTGTGGTTREAAELWVGVAGADGTTVFSNPTAPFAIRVNAVAIGSGAGRLVLLDAFTSSVQGARLQLDHSGIPGGVKWAAAMAAIRGVLQVPATPVETPSVGEPITENEDHEGDAIGHLLEQFKSHDKR
jgi:hypothetical protein